MWPIHCNWRSAKSRITRDLHYRNGTEGTLDDAKGSFMTGSIGGEIIREALLLIYFRKERAMMRYVSEGFVGGEMG